MSPGNKPILEATASQSPVVPPRKDDPCPIHGADCKGPHPDDAYDVWRYWKYGELQKSAARYEALAVAPNTNSYDRPRYLDSAHAARSSAFHLFA